MADRSAGGAGPTGYGSGPVIAMVGLLGGAVAVFGWGMTQLASADGGIVGAIRGGGGVAQAPIEHAVTPSASPAPTTEPTAGPTTEPIPDPEAPGPEGSTIPGTPPVAPGTQTRPGPDAESVIVIYPDTNRNGIPDPWEDSAGGPAGGTGGLPHTGGPAPDSMGAGDASAGDRRPAWETYVVTWGDTLSQISAETGVPVDRLAAVNDIANPDVIAAGASLMVPPA